MVMPASQPLKAPRQEKFVQELVKGASLTDAYKAAGFAPHRKNAQRLASQPKVAARLAYLQGQVAKRAVVTAADIADQLDDDRAFAKEKGQAAAMVSATMGKGKVLGLIIERRAHQFDLSNLSDDDLEKLEGILARAAKP